MKRPSKWTLLWLSWLAELGLLDLLATRSHRPRPRTFTEHMHRWFSGWRAVLLVGLMAALTWHFLASPDVKPVEPIWETP